MLSLCLISACLSLAVSSPTSTPTASPSFNPELAAYFATIGCGTTAQSQGWQNLLVLGACQPIWANPDDPSPSEWLQYSASTSTDTDAYGNDVRWINSSFFFDAACSKPIGNPSTMSMYSSCGPKKGPSGTTVLASTAGEYTDTVPLDGGQFGAMIIT